MNKVFIILLIGIGMTVNLYSQNINQKIIDTKTQKEILYGKCNLQGLNTGEFGDFFKLEYKYYIPDSITLTQIEPLFKEIKIQIVMGSWCGDSQQQVPRFIKVLDKLNYNTETLDILCIDHYFKAENFEKGSNKIEKVPTFIFYNNDNEIGRIIETPILTLEKDLLDILKANYLNTK